MVGHFFEKTTQILKDLKVQKHLKTTFRRIRLNVPGFVDPVIRSARISGRLFVRLKKWLAITSKSGWSLFRKKNSNFKRSQGTKTFKNHFSKNPIKRPRICRSRYKICKNLGTFIRTSQNWVFALFRPNIQLQKKNSKFRKSANQKMWKSKNPKIRKSENSKVRKSQNWKIWKSKNPYVRACVRT